MKINCKITKIMFSILISYLVICAMIFIFQRKLQYLPSGHLQEPKQYGLEGFEENILLTPDNIKITTWFKAPKNKEKIIVYFHGNAGNLGERSHKLKIFARDFGILAISYRGYAKSEGSPSEKGLLFDAKEATDFLLQKGYKNEDIILYGESLGSGVAIQHAAKFNPYGIILEAPYYSITEIAKRIYWYLPVEILLKDRFDSYKYATQIKAPIIIFHGTKDLTVPYKDGKKLFELFPTRKEFITIEGVGHLDFDEEFMAKTIKDFFTY